MKGLLVLLILIPLTGGCATVPEATIGAAVPSVTGIYHEVSRGETLWNISRTYDVELERVIKANHLPNASNIEVGQLIFIPGTEVGGLTNVGLKPKKTESFIWPAKGVVVSYFGSMKRMAKNKGIDIQAPEGGNVMASRSGKVTFSTNHLKGYGKTIIIDHLDGFQTVYAHNSQTLVEINQYVSRGEVIAKVGRTGRVNKPTLHFEIRKKHKPQNPFYYLP